MGFYASVRSGIPDPDVELDLTNSHLHSLEDVEIRPTLEVTSCFFGFVVACISAVRSSVLTRPTLLAVCGPDRQPTEKH
jgi:hypothetical protein